MASEQLAIPGSEQFERKEWNAQQLLSVALQNNAAIDVIERLAALREKELARQSEVDFNDAMNRTQRTIKRVKPDLSNAQNKKYASYVALDNEVRPIYSAEGFCLSFGSDDCPLPEHVRVICHVSRSGYTRRYQLDVPCDGKGAKGGDVMTKTDAVAAALSRGMRYLLKAIFNIPIGEDIPGSGVSMEELNKKLLTIEQCQPANLRDTFAEAYKWANETKDQNVIKAVVAAYEKRKRETSQAPIESTATMGVPLSFKGKK